MKYYCARCTRELGLTTTLSDEDLDTRIDELKAKLDRPSEITLEEALEISAQSLEDGLPMDGVIHHLRVLAAKLRKMRAAGERLW